MEKKKFKINLGTFEPAKGFGILSVILIHTVSYYDAEKSKALQILFYYLKMIAPGIMPMFLIIIGYRFRDTTFKKMLEKTFHDYIVPYFWVMIGYAIVYPIIMLILWKSWPNAIHETARFVLAFLLGLSKEGLVLFGYTLRFCAAAWFFLASFLALNLLNLLVKCKNVFLQLALVILCTLLGYVLLLHDFFYYCLPQGLMIIIYCYVGYLIKQYNLLERMVHSVWLYAILIPIALAEGIWGYFDISSGTTNGFLPNCIGSTCSGLLFVLLWVAAGQYEGKFIDLIRKIGTYSYWILAIHSVEMMALPWTLWPGVIPDHPVLAYGIEQFLRVILLTTCCCILKKIVRFRYKRRISCHV